MALKVTTPGPGINVGAIAGGTVGGVAAMVLALLVAMVLRRRRQRRSQLPPNPVELPQTGPKTPGEGSGRAELMENNEAHWGGVWPSELQSGEAQRGVGPDFQPDMR